ncbi:MAG TPA: ATP phosphoribosyltransferase regulatory subunit [Solirubrobacterales bacterium]|jgi:ATP phosphoribosyltransferase regulatory subunit|nr:ATP phosphoribosyltransferase regulatory subunit [Solirubrobacterales bacterium]
MIHPIPPGTRDVLPEEMRELRRLQGALIEVFEGRGYGEVATPALEYDEVLARGGGRSDHAAYRFFDEGGELLALRSEMTVPIARLVATRYGAAEPPHRLCYIAGAYQAVSPQRGEMREFLQAGVELIGAPAAAGTVEVIDVLEAALDAAGLGSAVIGLGDADLYRDLLGELGLGEKACSSALARLAAHDLVGLEEELEVAGVAREQVESCLALSQLRGGPEVLEQARELESAAAAGAADRLRDVNEALGSRPGGHRVQFDFGLMRDLGYYNGAILEVYDPALGRVLGGGGRYDGLMKRFGLDLSAAGFALYLERVQVARVEERRRGGGAR